ncbi:hypothetical protein M404DRAFT_144024 [Pisolithus tinctorius Marx 270]|uniref:Uncharacterized protein n=1 Tax=Pisolithus tinctorius Marx 270 TaxID=870435 RepID=A0A0C3NTK8_PISTI|nr:hypothetical protein M404DRAFT_144024 [Pisolithus tinctorius Marx 270]
MAGNLRITVSIPLNTSFVGGTVSHVQLRFAVDTSFEDFFSCICAKMDLDPKEAQLGYKYHTDRVHDPPHQLSNAQQLAEAFEHGHHLLKHTQVREVVLEIHNLASAAVGSENDNNQELATSMSFAAEFCKLKEHLKCAKHVGKYCYIQPTDGDHMEQDVYKLTSWAKGIFTGNATYDHPPESNLFDHTPSKQRRLSSTAAQNAPVIHVHLPNTGQLSGSRSGREPSLAMQYLTGPAPDEDDIFAVYPSISDALHQMHTSMPLLNMPQYEENLVSHGVAYVNTVSGISEDFFVDVVGMPLGAVRSFIAVACRLAWRARKGKERAANPSDSDKENEDSNASVWCGHTPEVC